MEKTINFMKSNELFRFTNTPHLENPMSATNSISSNQILCPGPLRHNENLSLVLVGKGLHTVNLVISAEKLGREEIEKHKLTEVRILLNRHGWQRFQLEAREVVPLLKKCGGQTDHIILELKSSDQWLCSRRVAIEAESDPAALNAQGNIWPNWSWTQMERKSHPRGITYHVGLVHREAPLQGDFLLGLYDYAERLMLETHPIHFEGGEGKATLKKDVPEDARLVLLENRYSTPLTSVEVAETSKFLLHPTILEINLGQTTDIELVPTTKETNVIWAIGHTKSDCPFADQLGKGSAIPQIRARHSLPVMLHCADAKTKFYQQTLSKGILKLNVPDTLKEGKWCLWWLPLDAKAELQCRIISLKKNPAIVLRRANHHLVLDRALVPELLLEKLSGVMNIQKQSTLGNGLVRCHGQWKGPDSRLIETSTELALSDESEAIDLNTSSPRLDLDMGMGNLPPRLDYEKKYFAWRPLPQGENPVGTAMSWEEFGVRAALRILHYPMWCSMQSSCKMSAMDYVMRHQEYLAESERDIFMRAYGYGVERMATFLPMKLFSYFAADNSPYAKVITKKVFDNLLGMNSSKLPWHRDLTELARHNQWDLPTPITSGDEVASLQLSKVVLSRLMHSSEKIRELYSKQMALLMQTGKVETELRNLFSLLVPEKYSIHDKFNFSSLTRQITAQNQSWWLRFWNSNKSGAANRSRLPVRPENARAFLSPGAHIPLDQMPSFVQFLELGSPVAKTHGLRVDFIEYQADDEEYNWLNPMYNNESLAYRNRQLLNLRKDVVCQLNKPETCGLDKTLVLNVHNQSSVRNQALQIPNYSLLELQADGDTSWTRYGSDMIIPLDSRHTRVLLKTRLVGQESIKLNAIDFSCLDIRQEVDLGVVTVV